MEKFDRQTQKLHLNRQTTVTVLGLGRMGTPMAARLMSAGFAVQGWDRTPDHAVPLIEAGAMAAPTPAAAAEGADVVLTMLADGDAVHAVMAEVDGPLSTSGKDVVWLQMSTVGIEWTDRLADLASAHKVAFVDAPVSGSVGPAEAGTLVVLASGPAGVRSKVQPVLDAISRRTIWLSPAGAGTRAKLVLNNWLVNLVETTAETLHFAANLGIDPEMIVELLEGPIGSPYALDKARHMLKGDFTPNFALKHAVKDADLALEAAKSVGVELRLTGSLIETWHRALRSGHGDDDLSVVYADTAMTA